MGEVCVSVYDTPLFLCNTGITQVVVQTVPPYSDMYSTMENHQQTRNVY